MRHFDCGGDLQAWQFLFLDRKSTRLNSSHSQISYAVFCLKKKKNSVHGSYYERAPVDGESAHTRRRTVEPNLHDRTLSAPAQRRLSTVYCSTTVVCPRTRR